MKATFQDDYKGIRDSDKETIAKMVELARENFERDGNLMPTAMLGNSLKNKMSIVGMQFGNQREKEASIAMIRKMIEEDGSDSIMLILESYTIPQEHIQDFMQNRHKYPTVSSHPKAIDIIMFSYENQFGTWSTIARVDCKAKKVLDTKVEFSEAVSSGLISGFIKKRGNQ